MPALTNDIASPKENQLGNPNFRLYVSVIIPAYNRCSLLGEAVESVLAQTHSNWELIIVDDGSTDDTINYIQSLNDERIRVLAMPHCGNIALLRNIGVENSTGEWIAFLDSDDTWVPEKLEIQLAALQNDKKKWCYGGFELMDEAGTTISNKFGAYHPFSGWILDKLVTYKATATTDSIMLSRLLFDEAGGFNPRIASYCPEDYEFILRLAMHAEAIAIPSLLVRVREYNGRTSRLFTSVSERTANVYKFFYRSCNDSNIKKLVHRQYAHHLSDAAEKNLYQKKYLRAIKYFAKAIANRDKPRHLLSSLKHGFIKHKSL